MRVIESDKVLPLFRLLLMNNKYAELIIQYIKAIINANTIDAVPVVRCKDCIRRYDTDECPMCHVSGGQYYEYTSDDGFCDRGERKTEQQKIARGSAPGFFIRLYTT